MEGTAASALALNAVVFACTIPLSARYRAAAVPTQGIQRTPYDLPLRAAAVAVVVAVVTTASHWIGSFAPGGFAGFPVGVGGLVAGIPPRGGGEGGGPRFAPAPPGAGRPWPGVFRGPTLSRPGCVCGAC